MNAFEVRASASLASIFALRMLGLFLILPVFAVHARSLPSAPSATLIGVAMGIYGLTQGILQIPYGAWSDRYGRKPVMIIGLVLFALGSFVAAASNDIWWTIAGRAIQGAGAISAAITAMIADATRDEHRTKAMAMVGSSIGLTFAISLVLAPIAYRSIGMGGIFAATGVFALIAIGIVLWVVPAVPRIVHPRTVPFREVLVDGQLLRLNFGIFVLHLVQMAMFMVVPVMLVTTADLKVEQHWEVYLPAVLGSFVVMVPMIIAAERGGRMKSVFLSAILMMVGVQCLFIFVDGLAWIASLLLVFFIAFNVLEATLPSLVSRIAPPSSKGAALGVYNTTQSLGLFFGGALGGWLVRNVGRSAVFEVSAVLMLVWVVVALGMRFPSRRPAQA